jgi:YHS domain-containing protein
MEQGSIAEREKFSYTYNGQVYYYKRVQHAQQRRKIEGSIVELYTTNSPTNNTNPDLKQQSNGQIDIAERRGEDRQQIVEELKKKFPGIQYIDIIWGYYQVKSNN